MARREPGERRAPREGGSGHNKKAPTERRALKRRELREGEGRRRKEKKRKKGENEKEEKN
jgi:hypothetical protein